MNNTSFKFTSNAASGEQFTVVSFTATESISQMYRYDITLKAPLSAAIDLDEILDNPAHFITDIGDQEYPVHGVISSFDEVRISGDYIFYQAVLVPRLWNLSTYKTNEIYTTEITVDNIIRTVLNSSDLIEGVDYELNGIQGSLLERDYVCQFGESDFDFISRLMENEGLYYFFEQGPDAEMLVIADDSHYDAIETPNALFDTAPQAHQVGETIQSWLCRKQRLPENVTVRDYNPGQPSLDVYNTQGVDTAGQGTEYLYGENFLTEGEAEHLAQIRAEAFACRKTRYYGESGICGFSTGYTFSLAQHPNDKYNDINYLIIEVIHEGQYLDQNASDNVETKPIYNNSFVATEASIPFRPPIITLKPRFFGTMTAFVYSEATTEMAEIDEQGRYRVHLPFDKADGTKDSSDPNRKASCWMRMAQPYVGEGEGMYFPLRGGTEVLLTFINGDPDRPVISGALPNASTPSLLTSEKPTESTIQTKGNNRIRMEDAPGNERVIIESPTANSYMRVGAPNDPITLKGGANIRIPLNETYNEPGAFAVKTNPVFGQGYVESISEIASPISGTVDTSTVGSYTLAYEHTGTDGVLYNASRTVIVYDPADDGDVENTHASNGIRISSAGDFWIESSSRQARYIGASPAANTLSAKTSDTDPSELSDLISNFGTNYNPSGLKNHKTGADLTTDSITSVMANADVTISSLDTVNTQEGNIYDFGGYWNYNLGNSYAEDHMDQSAELNANHSSDLLNTGGPGWSSINWPGMNLGVFDKDADNVDTNSYSESDAAGTATFSTEIDGDWDNSSDSDKQLWVGKTFGDAYSYAEGSSIEVTKGSSLAVQHGGQHIEVGYRGDGSISSWSHSESGVSQEQKWTKNGIKILDSKSDSGAGKEEEHKFSRHTGNMISWSISDSYGDTQNSSSYNWVNSASADFKFSASASFSFEASASFAINTAVSASLVIDIQASLAIGISFSPLDIKLNAPFNPGLSLSVERGGDTDISLLGVSVKIEGPGVDIKVKNAKSAEIITSTSELKTALMSLDNCGPKLSNAIVTLIA